jgi:2,3-dihydroxyphenylpropionate 1,2-dioxygenase
MFLDLVPAFTVGVGEVLGAGEAQTPSGPLPVDTDLARTVVDTMIDEGFDPAFSVRLTVDHGITHALQYLVPDLDVPIVPVVINMFAPPLVPLRRSHGLGRAIGTAVSQDGRAKRVAVIASGGLSHRLPWPAWFAAASDDDRFLVEAWLNGRADWARYEVRRREIIRAAAPDVNPGFDRWFLDLVASGDVDPVLTRSAAEIEAEAGNGAQEIRSWVAMAAAVGSGSRGRTLAYADMPAWLTGMGVAALLPHGSDLELPEPVHPATEMEPTR